MNAQFECCSCRVVFENNPGPHIVCPNCGWLYSRWINYDKWKLNSKRSKKFKEISGLKK